MVQDTKSPYPLSLFISLPTPALPIHLSPYPLSPYSSLSLPPLSLFISLPTPSLPIHLSPYPSLPIPLCPYSPLSLPLCPSSLPPSLYPLHPPAHLSLFPPIPPPPPPEWSVTKTAQSGVALTRLSSWWFLAGFPNNMSSQRTRQFIAANSASSRRCL